MSYMAGARRKARNSRIFRVGSDNSRHRKVAARRRAGFIAEKNIHTARRFYADKLTTSTLSRSMRFMFDESTTVIIIGSPSGTATTITDIDMEARLSAQQEICGNRLIYKRDADIHIILYEKNVE